MNTPLQRAQTAKRMASRFGRRFVASAIAMTAPAIATDVQASSGAFGALTRPTRVLAKMQANINEATIFRSMGEYVNFGPF
jgi:hypothetical protein